MRLLIVLAALLTPLSAQETMMRQVFDAKTDTHVEVLALFSQPSRGGFLPVRVKIANNLETDRSIQLRFTSSVNHQDHLQTRSSFDISAASGKTVTRDIMVPLCTSPNSYGTNSMVRAELGGTLGSSSNILHADRQPDLPEVLLSESLFTPNASALDSAATTKSGRHSGSSSFAAKFDPKQLPGEWLAFSGYDSIMMTDADWSNVPAGARNAITSWVNLGGQLVIYSINGATASSLGLNDDSGYGSTSIQAIGSDLKLTPGPTLDLVSKSNPVRARSTAIKSDFNSSWPLQQHYGSLAFHYGIFIAVLIIFGILVGPVNLFIFAKSGKRHRLFITTPLISLAASLVLIALIIFQDGFGGNGMRRVLMEVRPDAGQNAAFLHQEQFSRTGILAKSRFTVDPACFLAPVPIARSRWSRYTDGYNSRGTFNLQPGGGKMEASGDWWQSRSEQGQALSAVVPTRGRIERSPTPGTLVSTFDFPIKTLYYLDESKDWHRAERITTGKSFALTPIDASMADPAVSAQAAGFSNRNRMILERAKNRPGHFIAITGKAPAIDTLPGIIWKETQTIITGPVVGN